MAHPIGDPRAARRARLRAAQLAYLHHVEEETSLTPTEIAAMVQRSPATLTRFRNKAGYNGTLSPHLIRDIEEKTGVAAPPEAYEKVSRAAEDEDEEEARPATSIVLQAREPDTEPYQAPVGDPMAALITAAVAGRGHVVPWTLRARVLEEEGYMPGGVLIVDLNAEPQPGDVVCVQLYDWDQPGRTRTTFRLYHPPFIVPASREEGGRVPQLIDGQVGIKGVVEVAIRRKRR